MKTKKAPEALALVGVFLGMVACVVAAPFMALVGVSAKVCRWGAAAYRDVL